MSAPLGNKNAVKGNRLVGNALRRLAVQNPKKVKKACEALMNKAIEGDVSGFREFADRLDGKVPQPLTGFEGGPIEITQIKHVIVDKK